MVLKHELKIDGQKTEIYTCSLCNTYSTPNKYLYDAHVKSHTGEKPYK